MMTATCSEGGGANDHDDNKAVTCSEDNGPPTTRGTQQILLLCSYFWPYHAEKLPKDIQTIVDDTTLESVIFFCFFATKGPIVLLKASIPKGPEFLQYATAMTMNMTAVGARTWQQ